jgi:hypothetical protein
MFQSVDVSRVHVGERIGGEIDVFFFAGPPLMKGGI